MTDDRAKRERRKESDATRKPPPEGATYCTSKHAKIGVGNEQPPIDLRESGEDREESRED